MKSDFTVASRILPITFISVIIIWEFPKRYNTVALQMSSSKNSDE